MTCLVYNIFVLIVWIYKNTGKTKTKTRTKTSCSLRLLLLECSPENIVEFLKATNLLRKCDSTIVPSELKTSNNNNNNNKQDCDYRRL